MVFVKVLWRISKLSNNLYAAAPVVKESTCGFVKLSQYNIQALIEVALFYEFILLLAKVQPEACKCQKKSNAKIGR